MLKFNELKSIVDKCTARAKEKGEPCIYIEDILIEFFCTKKLPTFLSDYKMELFNFVEGLQSTKEERKVNQAKEIPDIDMLKTEDVYFHPAVYDFFQIYSMIDSNMTLVTFNSIDERIYITVILSIAFCNNIIIKQAYDKADLGDDAIVDTIRDYMVKTMKNTSSTFASILSKLLKQAPVETAEEPDDWSDMIIPSIKRMVPETPDNMLEEYCTLLNTEVKQPMYNKMIGREEELQELQEVMLRKDRPNALLIGEAGVGKSKLVYGFAEAINKKKCVPFFNDYKIYELNMTALTAGSSLMGAMEERVGNLISALEKEEKAILYIDEIHNIQNGSDRTMSVADMLKPAMTKGKIHLIGSTTMEDYRKSIASDSALDRRFKTIKVKEMDEAQTTMVLKGIKKNYEKYHNISYPMPIINQIVSLSGKYILGKRFPDKAIEVLDSVGAYCQKKNFGNPEKVKVVADDVYEVLAKLTNLPKIKLETSEIERMKTLSETIKEHIIGQDTAIDCLVDGVMISKSGLREKNKTSLTVFFKGPSGVGKTETVKQLSEILNIPLFRYDMSEFMEEHTVSKLIGSPPGYVGFENGKSGSGLLINQVKDNPYCIVLLDEIEKAHPKVLNIFLQVMDNGRLTSSSGVEVDFSNVYLIMTSNIGASASHKMASIGFGADSNKNASDEFFNSAFTPEFRNRLDATISFNNLSDEVMNKITDNNLVGLQSDLAEKKVKLSYDTSTVEYISRKASKENMGARPIKRIIHNEIKNIISKELVYGKLVKGGKLTITANENGLKLTY